MKKITLLILILSLTMVMTCPSFAESDIPVPEIQTTSTEKATIAPASTSGCTLHFTKLTSTSAEAHANATRPNVSSITSTIRLQKKSGTSYINTTQYSTKTVQKTFISHTKTFTINSSNSYRIKVTIKYIENGTTYSNTYYKTLS